MPAIPILVNPYVVVLVEKDHVAGYDHLVLLGLQIIGRVIVGAFIADLRTEQEARPDEMRPRDQVFAV